ncbi:glycerate kinase [Microbacterium trichothecenolyticum]|nr:glycerate kinase [Microbacterium trichothecenolyticum]
MKGSLSAAEACAAASNEIRRRFATDVDVLSCPMADGGEGSLDLILTDPQARRVDVASVDALGRPITAAYAWKDRGAHIEVARACGLPQVADVPLRPLEASTYGVGLIVMDALRRGAEHIFLYLGGTASSDAGAGLMEALGMRFTDDSGTDLPHGGGGLLALDAIDASELSRAALAARWTLVTDVTTPLLGDCGTAATFGPQKGASAAEVTTLSAAFDRLANIVEEATTRAIGQEPGSGAAGGIPALVSAFFDSTTVSGAEHFARHAGLHQAIESADLVITGEGRLDAQSFNGKVVGYVATSSRSASKTPPCVAIAGTIDRTVDISPYLVAAFALADGPATLSELVDRAAVSVGLRAADVIALCLASRRD